MIDIVTDRHADLHNGLLALLGIAGGRLPEAAHLYAAAYRPVLREGREEVDIWFAECRVGVDLPAMPLRLTGDTFVRVEFEFTYQEALRSLEVG